MEHLAWVAQKVDNAIPWLNHYPADSMVCFVNTYPVDSKIIRWIALSSLQTTKAWRLKICHRTKLCVSVADLGQKLLQNNQSLPNFCLWVWEAATLSLM